MADPEWNRRVLGLPPSPFPPLYPGDAIGQANIDSGRDFGNAVAISN
jgi:hypothetical protein